MIVMPILSVLNAHVDTLYWNKQLKGEIASL